MTKQFKTSKEVTLHASGFISDKDNNPIMNADFVRLQKDADYIVRLAAKMKGKDFKGAVPVQMEDLVAELTSEMNSEGRVQFVAAPKKPKSTVTDKLQGEAMEFMKFHENAFNTERINEYLQKFTPLSEFEEFGLFFEPGVAKLNKIYTIKEITDATEIMLSQL